MPNRDHPINVYLDKEQFDQLTALAKHNGWSKSEQVRASLKRFWQMELGGTAICADGRPCACPHMVARSVQAAPESTYAQPPVAPGLQGFPPAGEVA